MAALRDNTRKCVVELSVEIDGMGLEGFFAENDLDYEPLTILRREILPSGKSRAFVNDTPVLLDTLGRLAAHLLDVHSQHQSLLLSRPAFRLGLVDRYAGNDVPRTQYRQRYEQYRALQKELEELSARRRELARTQDYNRYLLDELDKSDLKDPGEQDELESLVARLSHSQQVKEDLQAAWQQMDTEETGVLSRLAETLSLLRRAEAYLPPQDQLTARTESALIELKDITERVCSLVEESEDDPQLLQRATERLDLLYTLLRKHNAKDLSALIALRESLRGEVSGLEQLDERIDTLQQECRTFGADHRYGSLPGNAPRYVPHRSLIFGYFHGRGGGFGALSLFGQPGTSSGRCGKNRFGRRTVPRDAGREIRLGPAGEVALHSLR